ncbi:hypothetical protein Golomagni_01451 [Golovinomyces magnicellulatus]|nr:hypothetical protein Golomagni_01451 [Golovinomyces magnicellulatus]
MEDIEYLDVASEDRRSRDHSQSPTMRPASRHLPRARSRSRSGLGKGTDFDDAKHSRSRASLSGGHSSSYYRRSPRSHYLARMLKKLRRLLRDLIYYMKKNPYKVIMLIIVPLVVSGVLPRLLAKFGIRLPISLRNTLKKLFTSSRKSSGDPTKGDNWISLAGNIITGLGGVGSVLGVVKMFK